MKTYLLFIAVFLFVHSASSQANSNEQLKFDKNKNVYELETACGTCMFKMKGDGCHLAIKFKDKDYFVDGTSLEDHGDAHDKEGFCNAIKKAKVQGSVVGDRFLITYFELVKNK